MERERVTVQEAAKRLGVTESAIRKRVQRGQLAHDKAEDGRVYVTLDIAETARDEVPESSYDRLIARLENENEFLRRELERKDAILLNMTETMRALNPPPEPRESPESTARTSDTAEPRSATEEQQEPTSQPQEEQRSWWRRIFGP